MSGGGSGGGGGTTQYNWNDTLKPLWNDQLSQGQALRDRPYEQYGGQRIAGLNADQNDALQNIRVWTQNGGGPAQQASEQQVANTAGGSYLSGQGFNPYATTMNPYMGEGPAFQHVLQNSNDEITRAYKNGTSADTTRLMNLSGVLGGSAHQNAVSNNEQDLAKAIANNTAGMQNDQYNRSSGLYESALGRANTDYEGERGRQLQASAMGPQMQQAGYQRLQELMGAGDIQRSYQQDLLNQGYQDWLAQRNYPYQQSDYFSGLLSRAQGGVSPNVSTQQSGYAASPYSQLLGGGLLAYGALH